jgi:hypothetical protein
LWDWLSVYVHESKITLNFHLFICIKILTLDTSFLLLWHLGFILGILFWFFVFSLSLSLGCVTHLSDKNIMWMTHQEITLSPGSHESPTQMRGWWWGIYTFEFVLGFPCEINEFDPELRILIATFPDWWSLLHPS